MFSTLKILLGFMPSVRFAECTQCHVCSSPKLPQCPNCKASFPQNYVIRKWAASDIPDDRVEIFVTCSGCQRSLKPNIEKCPECGATITREYASQSIKANATIGQAYLSAQKIETQNPAAVFALAVSIVITACAYFFDLPHLGWFLFIPVTMSMGNLLTIRQWFRWFRSFKSDHEDFAKAQRKVKHALCRWLAVLAAQVSLAILLASLIFLK